MAITLAASKRKAGKWLLLRRQSHLKSVYWTRTNLCAEMKEYDLNLMKGEKAERIVCVPSFILPVCGE